MIPDSGRVRALEAIRDGLLDGSQMILFMNDYTPTSATELSDLSQPGWAGYAPLSLTGWGDVDLDAGELAQVLSPDAMFTKTDSGDATVYGYALIDSEDNIILAKRFPGAPATLVQDVPFVFNVAYKFGVPT